MKNLYISYKNHNGGINNLIIVQDIKGNCATSTISKEKAIKNYYRKMRNNRNGKY